jgi:hypothetical protein
MQLREVHVPLRSRPATDRPPIWFLTCGRDIVILGVAGDLVEGLADQFEGALESLRAREADHFIVDLRRVTSIGSRVLCAIGRFAGNLSRASLWLAADGPVFELVDPPPPGAAVVRTPHEAVSVIRSQRS